MAYKARELAKQNFKVKKGFVHSVSYMLVNTKCSNTQNAITAYTLTMLQYNNFVIMRIEIAVELAGGWTSSTFRNFMGPSMTIQDVLNRFVSKDDFEKQAYSILVKMCGNEDVIVQYEIEEDDLTLADALDADFCINLKDCKAGLFGELEDIVAEMVIEVEERTKSRENQINMMV